MATPRSTLLIARLRYPSSSQLEALGRRIDKHFPDQATLDLYIREVIHLPNANDASDPIEAKNRIDQAADILRSLGLPRDQQNERSALTLLSLLDLRPETPWRGAKSPLMGITPMMEFFDKYYGKKYAPNTRETVRRTIHIPRCRHRCD